MIRKTFIFIMTLTAVTMIGCNSSNQDTGSKEKTSDETIRDSVQKRFEEEKAEMINTYKKMKDETLAKIDELKDKANSSNAVIRDKTKNLIDELEEEQAKLDKNINELEKSTDT
ncbi:MAG: hypothetical protein PF590_00565, partial [Candidatus Delongbacteria bacterium]|nr:hypothetical protein [Candidatus Delongbacteria bacterium]